MQWLCLVILPILTLLRAAELELDPAEGFNRDLLHRADKTGFLARSQPPPNEYVYEPRHLDNRRRYQGSEPLLVVIGRRAVQRARLAGINPYVTDPVPRREAPVGF